MFTTRVECASEWAFMAFMACGTIYWTNKVRDQTFNVQFLQDFELLVK